jgi:mono/diheme cytochrome c family protein
MHCAEVPLIKWAVTFANRARKHASIGAILLVAVVVPPSQKVCASPTAVERGRQVYVAERCARCHTQRTDPGAQASVDPSRGPDLSQVAARRSALWLKMHFYNPREVSGSSVMPHYAFLFKDRRGNDLVAYLSSLGASGQQHRAGEQQWRLSDEVLASATPADGPQLYNRYCATCHTANGRTRLRWQSGFIESPAILVAGEVSDGTMQDHATAKPESARVDHLAQIIKFGIPASDMAGHENMPDKNIASLAVWLTQKTSVDSIPSP